MSLTPTDDPDGRTDTARDRAPEGETASPSLWSRCRAALARAVSAVVPDRSRDADPSDPPLPDHAAAPPECSEVPPLDARTLPLTYPTRADDDVDNDSELVADCDESTLTISHPDHPEARIESDTWTDLKR